MVPQSTTFLLPHRTPTSPLLPSPLRSLAKYPSRLFHSCYADVSFPSNRIGSYDSHAYCTNKLVPQLHGRSGYVRSGSIPICRLLSPFERPAYVSHIDEHASKELEDYRGPVVLVNEDSGVAVTVLGSKEISVQEEPTIWEGGHKKDHQSPQNKRSTMNIFFSSSRVRYNQITRTESQNLLSS